MSSLLEALKRAERAKEEAQRRVKPDEAVEKEPAEGFATAQPLELEPEPERTAPTFGADPACKDIPGEEAVEVRCKEEFVARSAIERDLQEPNPKRAFPIALGTLAIAALVAGAYLWSQLQPAPAFVNSNPPRPTGEKPADPAGGEARLAGATSDLPGAAAAMQAIPEPPASFASRESRPTTSKTETMAKRVPASPSATQQEDPARTADASRAPASIHPRVQSGYMAYQSGDLASAHAEYQQALREQPANRDALLGLAAIETRAQRYQQAESHYRRLLQWDPRDPHAHAGLLALRGPGADSLQAESRIKTMLAVDPGTSVLHFTLGNLYAQQGRWAEAQQAYLNAHAADTENPDFVFNLAVSLEHLHQPAAALEQYRRALELADRRAAHFSPESVRQRVAQLSP